VENSPEKLKEYIKGLEGRPTAVGLVEAQAVSLFFCGFATVFLIHNLHAQGNRKAHGPIQQITEGAF